MLLAYVVRRISIHDYGIYLLAQSLAAFLYLLELGMGSILVPLYVSTFTQKGIAEVGALASTLTMAMLSLGVAGAFGLSLMALLIPRVFRLPSGQTALAMHVLIIMSVAVSLNLPQMPLEQLCKAFHRFDCTNQIQIAAIAIRVVLTVAVVASGKGIVGLAAVQIAVALLRLGGLWLAAPAAIAGLTLGLCFRRNLLPDVWRSSRWAFSDDISRRIGMNAEQVVLGAVGSFEQVAIFGVGSRLPAHMYQFAARGLSVLVPTFSQHHAERDIAQLRITFINALWICVTCLLPLSTFAVIGARPLISTWAGPTYLKAAPVLAWLLVSALAIILTLPSDIILYSHDHVRYAARFSILETLGKIAIALALAARFGAAGVAAGVAMWHWCMNLFFYLPAACRVADIRPTKLWRNTIVASSDAAGSRTGNFVLIASYLTGTVCLLLGMRLLPTPTVFGCLILVSSLYAAIWIRFAAAPLWRQARTKATAIP